jgi:hypothetical protein
MVALFGRFFLIVPSWLVMALFQPGILFSFCNAWTLAVGFVGLLLSWSHVCYAL